MGRYKCADCDNIMQCEYFHNRKRTSKICSEFDNSFETIPKDQYENRLKADMVAMLKDLSMEIGEIEDGYSEFDEENERSLTMIPLESVDRLIQQKINELKEAAGVKDDSKQ